MFVKIRCPHCGQLYWKGSRHQCPVQQAPPQQQTKRRRPFLDPDNDDSDYYFLRFLDLALWIGWVNGCFGCLLPPILLAGVLVVAWAVHLH